MGYYDGMIKDIGRPTLLCVLFRHKPGYRNPSKPDQWLGLACQRCGRYPVSAEGLDPLRDEDLWDSSVPQLEKWLQQRNKKGSV